MNPLIVVVDSNREGLLRLVLADYILVEDLLDLHRGRDPWCSRLGLTLGFLGKDLITEGDTLITDVDRGTGVELLDRVLGLATEGTTQVFIARHDTLLQGARPDPRPQRLGPVRYLFYSSAEISTTSLCVDTTWSIIPYSLASTGLMKRSRSTSSAIFSTSCPVWCAKIWFSRSRA